MGIGYRRFVIWSFIAKVLLEKHLVKHATFLDFTIPCRWTGESSWEIGLCGIGRRDLSIAQ